jgi:hypothetical protein
MSIKLDKWGLPDVLDDRDTCHNAGFCALAYLWNRNRRVAGLYNDPVRDKLWRTFWPYKNPSYRYSNSEGFTKWFYDKVLHKWNFDPYKGLNGDQTQPMNVYFAETRQFRQLLKFTLGMILRLGFYPNFEHTLFKLGHWSPVFRGFRLRPLYWLTDMVSYFSSLIELKRPMQESTTNKIRMFITLAQAEKQPTRWTKKIKERIKETDDYKAAGCFKMYWLQVFSIYWKPTSPLGQIIHKLPFGLLDKE